MRPSEKRTGRRVVLWCAVWSVVGWASHGASEAAEPLRLRILSYNIHHGAGVDGKLDLPRIAGVIRGAEPDLVALQEVDRIVERSGRVDQPAELAKLLDMHVAFGANIRLQGGQYGNAVLSKFPLVRHENRLLPNVDRGEQRGLLDADVGLPGGRGELRFLVTHFDHRPDDRERRASVEQVNRLAMLQPDRPTILAGDLNDGPSSAVLRELDTRWRRTNDEPRPTVPVDRPVQQIDFVLVRPVDRWKIVETRVLDEAVASDHRAVLAVVELR